MYLAMRGLACDKIYQLVGHELGIAIQQTELIERHFVEQSSDERRQTILAVKVFAVSRYVLRHEYKLADAALFQKTRFFDQTVRVAETYLPRMLGMVQYVQ